MFSAYAFEDSRVTVLSRIITFRIQTSCFRSFQCEEVSVLLLDWRHMIRMLQSIWLPTIYSSPTHSKRVESCTTYSIQSFKWQPTTDLVCISTILDSKYVNFWKSIRRQKPLFELTQRRRIGRNNSIELLLIHNTSCNILIIFSNVCATLTFLAICQCLGTASVLICLIGLYMMYFLSW